ncbi:MAG: phosphopantothenoylcysteine decarboxylase [Planctomycetota bacterium]
MASFLVTAGPTREHLDDVRFLSNGSTGRMGYSLVQAALDAGHRVVLASGPTQLEPPVGAEVRQVVSAQDMLAAVEEALDGADVVIGAAAVADARPAVRYPGKPPKSAAATIELVPNPDIIAAAAAAGGRPRAVLGFALQSLDQGVAAALERGRAKLRRKALDAIAINAVAAMGASTSEVVVAFADGREESLGHASKAVTAARLVEIGLELWRSKR